jgi:hypothetical protein
MLIRSNLFSQGHPLKREPGLSAALEGHKRGVVNKINGVSDLAQMTDPFLGRLVRESIVEPLVIRFDRRTKAFRAEQLDGWGRGPSVQVARLSIPFTGEADLLKFSPDPCGLTLPLGEVYGNAICFDVIVEGDAQRVKDDVRQNCQLLAACAEGVNKQVRSFNESLPGQIQAAFTAKLDELVKRNAIFDELGIKDDEPEPAISAQLGHAAVPRPRRGKARATQIIQVIGAMYVEQLNQVNYNAGDVNNAIQGAI